MKEPEPKCVHILLGPRCSPVGSNEIYDEDDDDGGMFMRVHESYCHLNYDNFQVENFICQTREKCPLVYIAWRRAREDFFCSQKDKEHFQLSSPSSSASQWWCGGFLIPASFARIVYVDELNNALGRKRKKYKDLTLLAREIIDFMSVYANSCKRFLLCS